MLHEGHLYGLDDGDSDDVAHLVCLEAATGKEMWRGDNYGHGQVLLAQGHLVINVKPAILPSPLPPPMAIRKLPGYHH